MALSFQASDATLTIPGAYASIVPTRSAAGLSATGILAILGEASQGPDYTQETPAGTGVNSLGDNAYGPDQLSDVIHKYGDGPIVDAMRAIVSAANDVDITGAPAKVIIVKTNVAGKASGALGKIGGGTYGTIFDRKGGAPGNQINYQVTATQPEVLPTTGAFTLAVTNLATDLGIRVNGGARLAYSIGAAERPPVTVAALDALTGLDASGGTDRLLITAIAGTLAVGVVSGNTITLTISTAWNVTPQVGDTLYISTTSAVKGGSNQNAGSYVVTNATTTVVTATKLLDAAGTLGQITAPVNVSATAVASASADAQAYAPVTINNATGNVLDGVGKTLEIADLATAAGRLSKLAYAKGTTTPVTWVSASGAAQQLVAGAEYQPSLALSRASDGLSDVVQVGGNVLLRLGYTGTTATGTIAAGVMTLTVVGGTGTSPSPITLANFPTMGDLVTYLNTLTGFAAAVGDAPAGASQSPLTLDPVAFTFATDEGAMNGRVKQDGYVFWKRTQSSPVQLSNPELTFTLAPAHPLGLAGLPATTASSFLAGGTRGATTDAMVAAGLLALESVVTNFVIPLFSCDASSDIADGLTDAGSTYTIASVNANLKSHVLALSTKLRKKSRQGWASFRGTFPQAKATAAGLASYRLTCTFQDDRSPNATGSITSLRPYIYACKAAAMQAAGLYKSIMRKGINTSGAIQNAGDFNEQNDSQVTAALQAGLLPVRKDDSGLWYWVSDQTTYGQDSNFFLNSAQVVYCADVLTATARQRMEKAIVGQSIVDTGVSVGASVLESVFSEALRLKLIAPSDDAPAGYKNVKVRLVNGNALDVNADVKINGAIAFINISFTASQVIQG